MIEVTGDLWTYPADIRVITTNGSVTSKSEGVMGRGCALEATKRYPRVKKMLGALITAHGNHCFLLFRGNPLVLQMPLVSFPVKHRWFHKANLHLIRRSAEELVVLADSQKWVDRWDKVVLPRPGCGNGRLRWEEVQPVLASVLDDRFHVITFKDV